jgi:poly-gamma-glutamate capsule biosynthesis protein CapA/YwtB (metallophosphatase superfamily)
MASDDASERDARAGPLTPAARRRSRARPAPPRDLGEELSGLEARPARVRVAARRPAAAPRRPRTGSLAARPPYSPESRVAALLALGMAALAVLFQLVALLTSGPSVAGLAGLSAEPSMPVVAPGGRIALDGEGAPPDSRLVLETRAPGQGWRRAGDARSDDEGDFRVEGRAVARQGKLALRARVVGGGASAPVTATVRTLRLASVGDVNLGDVPGEAIAVNGPRYPWESAGAALREADIAFGNLECAVSDRGMPFPKRYNFRATPAALTGLRRHSGIDVLNLANNHVGDFGPGAMLDTVRAVRRLGMEAVGAGRDLRSALAPQVVERLGLRIAFVGFSNILPLEFAADAERPGVAWATPEAVDGAVRAARRRADVVVATFHWGIEKATFETAEQQQLAQVAARAGANLVIGAHPHVLQPLRRAGAALVAYSLGNFVFAAQSSDTASTGILETELTAEGVSAARWRTGRIAGGRPLLDGSPPRRLPLRDPAAMAAGLLPGA